MESRARSAAIATFGALTAAAVGLSILITVDVMFGAARFWPMWRATVGLSAVAIGALVTIFGFLRARPRGSPLVIALGAIISVLGAVAVALASMVDQPTFG